MVDAITIYVIDKSFAFYTGGQIDASRIDKAQGIIPGVRIITEGVALGHGLKIDDTTIDQILQASTAYTTGVKVKLDHEGGSKDIVGWVTNFQKGSDSDGAYLKADLHLIKTHPSFDYILELASTIPDTFGLSVFFTGKPQEIDGEAFARCNKLFSCDIVTEPAANPAGMFSIGPITRTTMEPEEKSKVDKPKNTMSEEELHAALNKWAEKMGIKTNAPDMEDEDGDGADALDQETGPEKKVTTHLHPDGSKSKKVEEHHPAPKDGEDDEADEDNTGMKSKGEAQKFAQKVTAEILKNLSASGVRLPASKSGDLDVKVALEKQEKTMEKFEDICVRLRTEGIDGRKFKADEAVGYAVKHFRAAHQDYMQRLQEDSPYEMQRQQAMRAGEKYEFASKVEHWKVQGTPKPSYL
jgi:hypothetical protein